MAETLQADKNKDLANTKIQDSKDIKAEKNEVENVKESKPAEPKRAKQLTLNEKIVDIQIALKVPKDKDNMFGGFNYRTAEDIEEKIKSFEKKLKVLVHMVNEEPINVGSFNYIKSTWIIQDLEGAESKTFSAVAREDDAKKKMDSPQVSGSASSYARKKALDGFFMLDNRKDDPDSNEAYRRRDAPQVKKRVTKQQLLNYPLTVNGQKTTMGALYEALKGNQQSEHYKNAKKVAEKLNEKEAKILNALIRSESKQNG